MCNVVEPPSQASASEKFSSEPRVIWAQEKASAVSRSFYYIETVRSVEDFLSCYIFLAPEPSVVSGFVELQGGSELEHGLVPWACPWSPNPRHYSVSICQGPEQNGGRAGF